MKKEFEIEPGIIISKLDVKNGDTLIMTIDTDIWDRPTIKHMADSLQKIFPNNKIVYVSKNCDIAVKKSTESEKKCR